jgi:hypothetical protein
VCGAASYTIESRTGLVEAKPRRVARTTEPTVKDLLLLADAVILKVAQPYFRYLVYFFG